MIVFNEYKFNNRDVFTATVWEHKAIKELHNMPNIVIKSADKGGAVVVQSREQYLKQGLRQLANSQFYKKQEFDTTLTHMNTINEFTNILFVNGETESSIYEYLLNKECRTPILYLLPKIHKCITPPQCRPIISAVNSHTVCG